MSAPIARQAEGRGGGGRGINYREFISAHSMDQEWAGEMKEVDKREGFEAGWRGEKGRTLCLPGEGAGRTAKNVGNGTRSPKCLSLAGRWTLGSQPGGEGALG